MCMMSGSSPQYNCTCDFTSSCFCCSSSVCSFSFLVMAPDCGSVESTLVPVIISLISADPRWSSSFLCSLVSMCCITSVIPPLEALETGGRPAHVEGNWDVSTLAPAACVMDWNRCGLSLFTGEGECDFFCLISLNLFRLTARRIVSNEK